MIDRLRTSGKTALFLSVRPMQSLHVVESDEDGIVTSVEDMQQASVWINGGFFVFRREILDYVERGEELVVEGFRRLIGLGELLTYRYTGFWEPMDTIKDKQRLDAFAENGRAPWQQQQPIPVPDTRVVA
jgi:glucose-1-phosphate cytidylyltransferase